MIGSWEREWMSVGGVVYETSAEPEGWDVGRRHGGHGVERGSAEEEFGGSVATSGKKRWQSVGVVALQGEGKSSFPAFCRHKDPA